MKPLTETPEPGSVDDEYFYRMLSPQALTLSAPYNNEESEELERCLCQYAGIKDMNFIAIGGGELWELRKALKYTARYVCIEPLANIFINDSVKFLTEQHDTISIVAKKFGAVMAEDLPSGNSFFMFLFNILAYINDPIESINRLLRQGDILFMSTWANTPEAHRTRMSYFEFLNEDQEIIIDPAASVGLAHFDNFPFEKLRFYKRHERIKGAVTDILIIYT
jgi:hypothetical protein